MSTSTFIFFPSYKNEEIYFIIPTSNISSIISSKMEQRGFFPVWKFISIVKQCSKFIGNNCWMTEKPTYGVWATDPNLPVFLDLKTTAALNFQWFLWNSSSACWVYSHSSKFCHLPPTFFASQSLVQFFPSLFSSRATLLNIWSFPVGNMDQVAKLQPSLLCWDFNLILQRSLCL